MRSLRVVSISSGYSGIPAGPLGGIPGTPNLIIDNTDHFRWAFEMARIARVVAPGMPQHVTQQGNRHLQTFFGDDDYQTYLELMSEWCAKYKVQVWAYCLMPNHVHLIAGPETKDGLNLAIGEAHRRYTRRVNFRKGWRQGRFSSFILDKNHLLACTRYVELNPIRAGMVKNPQAWRWSSADAHPRRKDDILVRTKPLLAMIKSPWKKFYPLAFTNRKWIFSESMSEPEGQ
jgi:putative transposase